MEGEEAMVTGKSKTNKSYKHGFAIGKADAEAGKEKRMTYRECMELRRSGQEVEYVGMPQPSGYYASEMERGYDDAYNQYKGGK